MMCHLLQIQNN